MGLGKISRKNKGAKEEKNADACRTEQRAVLKPTALSPPVRYKYEAKVPNTSCQLWKTWPRICSLLSPKQSCL